jgi:hypothetical protein
MLEQVSSVTPSRQTDFASHCDPEIWDDEPRELPSDFEHRDPGALTASPKCLFLGGRPLARQWRFAGKKPGKASLGFARAPAQRSPTSLAGAMGPVCPPCQPWMHTSIIIAWKPWLIPWCVHPQSATGACTVMVNLAPSVAKPSMECYLRPDRPGCPSSELPKRDSLVRRHWLANCSVIRIGIPRSWSPGLGRSGRDREKRHRSPSRPDPSVVEGGSARRPVGWAGSSPTGPVGSVSVRDRISGGRHSPGARSGLDCQHA